MKATGKWCVMKKTKLFPRVAPLFLILLFVALAFNQYTNISGEVVAKTEAPLTPVQFLPFIFQPPWEHAWEAENTDDFSVGGTIPRSNACGLSVHGQFGTINAPPWSSQAGFAKYTNIDVPQTVELYVRARYSKNSPSSKPIDIYLDDETVPRGSFTPLDQGSWNSFAWTDPIDLGSVDAGLHDVTLYTDGQQYGVADLDLIQLFSHVQVPIIDC